MLNTSQSSDVAAQTAPAGRGLRIRQYKRDIFAQRGNAFVRGAIYLKARSASTVHSIFTFRSIARFNIALLGAACALGCFAMPAATASPEAAPSSAPSPLKIWPGDKKPTFLLDDLHGERRDLQAFAGKIVLVHFFATWCESCVREIGSLQRLAAATHNKPLIIVAVDVAEVDLRVRTFFAKQPVDFAVLLDRERKVSKSWDVSALPSTFVLDAALMPRLFVEGDLDWSRPDVLAAIESLNPSAGRPHLGTIHGK